MIIICFPTKFEAQGLFKELDCIVPEDKFKFPVYEADLKGHEVIVAIIGIGQKPALPRVQKLYESFPKAQGLIVAGFAGALAPDLKFGEVYFSTNSTAVSWHEKLTSLLSGKKLFTSTELVPTSAAKRNLFENTGSEMVDMEMLALHQFLSTTPLPHTCIRIISDDVSHELDVELINSTYDQHTGMTVTMPLIKHLLKNPQKIFSLIQMGKTFSLLQKDLANAIQKVVNAVDDSSLDAEEHEHPDDRH